MEETKIKGSEIVVTDRRLMFASEGSTGLAIRDAHKQAEAVLDTRSNSIRDDATFVPLGDRVTVKRIAEAELTRHGINIPDSAKNPAAFGVVVGVGQGRYNLVGQLIPLRVHKGAVVMFGRYAGSDLPLFGMGNKDLVTLREEEIMGVIMPADVAAKVAEDSDPQIEPVQ